MRAAVFKGKELPMDIEHNNRLATWPEDELARTGWHVLRRARGNQR